MAAGIPIDVEEAVAAAGNQFLWQIHKHIQVAAFTVSVLEMIATLPDEIELMWPTNMSLMKAVYFVNKYSLLLDITLTVLVDFTLRTSHDCDKSFQALTYWYTIATLFSEFILLARSWALWACDRHMLYNTIFIAAMMVPHTFYVDYDMLRTNTANFAAANGLTIQLFGCMPAINDEDVWPAFTYMICSETMIVLITLLKRYLDQRSWTDRHSYANKMLDTLYRDGTCFWAIVLAYSVLNMVMLFCAPRELSYSMQMPLRTIHSALCTRVLLNLRKVAARTSRTRHDSDEEELDFLTTLALEPLPVYSESDESDESMPRTEDFELREVVGAQPSARRDFGSGHAVSTEKEKVIYYLYGGGHIAGSAHPKGSPMWRGSAPFYEGALGHFGKDVRISGLEYRLSSAAPFAAENPFPASLIDAIAGYRCLVEDVGFHPSQR